MPKQTDESGSMCQTAEYMATPARVSQSIMLLRKNIASSIRNAIGAFLGQPSLMFGFHLRDTLVQS